MSKIEVITSVTEMRMQIQRIIKEAEECLYIISPYVKIDNEMKMLLERKGSSESVNIRFVYGKKKSLESETKAFLDAMPHIQKHFVKDLHAKCYLNEKMALVTSMNLYDYSMINNVEMGVFVDTDKGFLGLGSNPIAENLYKDIRSKAEGIVKLNEAFPALVESNQDRQRIKPASSVNREASVHRAVPVIEAGLCIRCREEIPADPGKPFCAKDFKSWNRYKNEEYEENYCHLCGKSGKTSLSKPVCRSCYQTHKEFVEWRLR